MEKKFGIICDAACDICEDLRAANDIDIVASHISLPDGSEVMFANKWEAMSREEFYASLKKSPTGFTTAPGNVAEFTAAFEKYTNNGQGVLAISISTGISGTNDFMNQAKNEVLKKNPAAEIMIVDSMRFTVGFGLLAIFAAKKRAEGLSLADTKAYIEEIKNCVHQAGWLDDLSFVASKGRMTHAKAFFGSLAGIKPIGEFDYNGLTTVIGKCKGAKQAYAALMDYLEKTGVDLKDQDILIAQTNRMAAAEEYARQIKEKFNPKSVRIVDVFPACGVNVGPGLMAAYYVGKPITKGLVEERAILEKFLEQK